MTPDQKELARHALGLSRRKRSFRNHFVAGESHSDFENWNDMVIQGYAKCHEKLGLGAGTCFWLTNKGAMLALNDGESLCPEDFPERIKS